MSNLELAAQASARSHWLSHTAPPPTPVNSGLADHTSAWPHWPLFTAPPPAPASSGLAAQASAQPHWPPFTAPPPAPASSGLAAQASAQPHWPPFTAPPPAPASSELTAQASVWPHALPNTAPPPASFSSLLQTKPQYSLFTPTPVPVPSNAIASEPPQVAYNIRAEILADDFLVISPPDAIPAVHILTIQKVFSELGIPIAEEKTMGPATSIEYLGINLGSVKLQKFRTLAPEADKSSTSSTHPSTPSSKQSLPEPSSHTIKGLRAGSIKGYLSGIQLFHKLRFGTPSPGISIPAEKFSNHSFRIGAATSAAQKGLSKQQIQTLGRWSSEAFQSYIRTNQSHIKEAHQTLIGRQAK
ncbi:proline and serine-rich 1-like protein [Labeo rohita]|uniref:Proline and serine-rich 1-like protein n=1 Tax=Labeo rohita TaxID=84645 RepID=A0A498NPG4_LABRO|nr:proline and serine-rich 1-like protein [Labeo rohita]